MSSFTHLVKSLLLPLLAAALLYVLLAHLILPFLRRNRSRYSNYLPLAIPELPTSSPSTWRTRITSSLLNLFAPSYAARHAQHAARYRSASMTSEELFDDEEGEGMVGFDPLDEGRREALEQRRSLMRVEEERRLGRELEEGFRDESSDEEMEGGDERRRSLSRSRGRADC